METPQITDDTLFKSGLTLFSSCAVASFSSDSKPTNSGAELEVKIIVSNAYKLSEKKSKNSNNFTLGSRNFWKAAINKRI